ncbi:MAG: PDZ domain-containing protein [Planctomycetales bacterium]|nr:PDZ domain-containing protein [Planctomycetales bacterium]
MNAKKYGSGSLRCLSAEELLALSLALFFAAAQGAAQDSTADERRRQRDRVREPAAEAPAERPGGIPRELVNPETDDAQQGADEGMPNFRSAPQDRQVAPYWLPPDRQQWKLGVQAYNTASGVVVTRVLPGSSAQQAGLERGDRIVAIDGFQVGWVKDRLFPLGAELQRQGGRHGRVQLLVQNVRNRVLLNLDVQLDARR